MSEVVVIGADAPVVREFLRLFAEETLARPLPRVVSPRLVLELSVARLMRVTLKLVAEAKLEGVEVAGLRSAFEALEVPTRLRELVERKLVADGVVKVSGDRLVFIGTKATWDRLARKSS